MDENNIKDGKNFIRAVLDNGESVEYEIPRNIERQYAIVEKYNGLYKSIKLYEDSTMPLSLMFYYTTEKHYLFVYEISIQKDEENQKRSMVIFQRLDIRFINNLKEGESLINKDTELVIFESSLSMKK